MWVRDGTGSRWVSDRSFWAVSSGQGKAEGLLIGCFVSVFLWTEISDICLHHSCWILWIIDQGNFGAWKTETKWPLSPNRHTVHSPPCSICQVLLGSHGGGEQPLCLCSEVKSIYVIFAFASALPPAWNRKAGKGRPFSKQIFLICTLKICG